MKSVYIIRHAKSSWDDPELPDVTRPLNKRGVEAAIALGEHLTKLHEKPDLIISSPATRAYHTAINVAQVLGYRLKNIMIDPTIYYDGEQEILNLLKWQEDLIEHIFIVGHEPTCSDVVFLLTGSTIPKFSTASVCKIELDIDKWEDINGSKGKKIFYLSPKQINN